ncbi:hypothetical protein [Bradyrhizobium sp. SZCCHNR1093]|uniref:hypothetical protein n=1 Tax=Bradyrhizobium sp. SZCCHNR1093 TaxID=3057368 RepID=UPI0028EAE0DF|nr:hypothetical protein [Bradyrhizobium sp. SZCCHNR1093]
MNRLERLREYKRKDGPSGESRSQKTLDYWANYASENSLHPGRRGPKAGGPGRSDKNHLGEDDYMPNVHRTGS